MLFFVNAGVLRVFLSEIEPNDRYSAVRGHFARVKMAIGTWFVEIQVIQDQIDELTTQLADHAKQVAERCQDRKLDRVGSQPARPNQLP